MNNRISGLELAFNLADIADWLTLKLWSPHGVESKIKADGTSVTSADGDAEDAILKALTATHSDDGFLGEEIGSRPSRICAHQKSSSNTAFCSLKSLNSLCTTFI